MTFKIIISKWCDRIYHMWSISSWSEVSSYNVAAVGVSSDSIASSAAVTTVFWVSRDNLIADSLLRWV